LKGLHIEVVSHEDCQFGAIPLDTIQLSREVKFGAGATFDETEPPSEAFDRREFVVLMGESHSGQKQKFLPIIRSGNGKSFGFGESEVPAMDEMKGRFAQLLPMKVPDAAIRDVAKAMLQVKGAGRATPGATPRLARSRR
jgi:hypothetical protein